MKEATGETNMTIITVVLIGLITLIATPIVRNLISSTEKRSCCVNNGGIFSGGHCYTGQDANGNPTGEDDTLMTGCSDN